MEDHPPEQQAAQVALSETFSTILASLDRQTKVLVQLHSLKPTSTKSEREHHQYEFKQSLRKRFKCDKKPGKTKCMILNVYFESKFVVAAHIIGMTNRDCLTLLSLDCYHDLWSDRNGLLIHEEFEKRFESQEITFLYDPDSHAFTVQVLFDDVLRKPIGNLTRRVKGFQGPMGDNALLFEHINGCPLMLPPLVFPYRRAIYYVSSEAYKRAIGGRRPHECALRSNPTPEKWSQILAAVSTASEGFAESSVVSAS